MLPHRLCVLSDMHCRVCKS